MLLASAFRCFLGEAEVPDRGESVPGDLGVPASRLDVNSLISAAGVPLGVAAIFLFEDEGESAPFWKANIGSTH